MDRASYEITIRSIRGALHHLRSVDATELLNAAMVHGTIEDVALVGAVVDCLAHLPRDRH